jgi:hypothetical protein
MMRFCDREAEPIALKLKEKTISYILNSYF